MKPPSLSLAQRMPPSGRRLMGRLMGRLLRRRLRRCVLRLALAGHLRWVHALPALCLVEGSQ